MGWPYRLNHPTRIPLHFVPVQQIEVEGQYDRILSNTEACMEPRDATEIPHKGKNGPDQHFLTT